jgi:hypothetical protein
MDCLESEIARHAGGCILIYHTEYRSLNALKQSCRCRCCELLSQSGSGVGDSGNCGAPQTRVLWRDGKPPQRLLLLQAQDRVRSEELRLLLCRRDYVFRPPEILKYLTLIIHIRGPIWHGTIPDVPVRVLEVRPTSASRWKARDHVET